MSGFFALVVFAVPAMSIWLVHHHPLARRMGVVVICYGAGLLVGNLGILSSASQGVAHAVGTVCIGLALPLLLMSLELRRFKGSAGRALVSMVLATAAVVAVASSLFYLYRGSAGDTPAHLAAMAVGSNTGGTPNLAAIKAGLGISDGDYLLFHSIDTLIGALYLLVMVTVGPPLFRRWLPAAPAQSPRRGVAVTDEDDYSGMFGPLARQQLMLTLAVAAVTLGGAYLAAHWLLPLLGTQQLMPVLVLLLTSAGIGLSLTPLGRRLEFAYRIGMYLIYVFCFAIACATPLATLVELEPMVAVFSVAGLVGSVALHALLCRLAGVDSNTFMITSVAAVCSPPFVPLVARALKQPGLILAGMMTGILGYAIGNYLGISLALILLGLRG